MNQINLDQFSNNKEIEKIIENLTLQVFNVGTKPENWKIICNLPSDVKTIMEYLNLTKVPVNNRLNELEKCGLLIREKGQGRVYPTELTELFRNLIVEVQREVENNLSDMLPKIMEL